MTSPIDPRMREAAAKAVRRLRRVLLLVFAVAFFALAVLPRIISFGTDWLWFQEVGFTAVFTTSILWRIVLFVVGGAVALAFLYGNVRLARRQSQELPAFILQREDSPRPEVVRAVPRVLTVASLVVSLLVALATSALWMTFLKGAHGVDVGATDPVFGRDVGFYLFTLPAVSAALGILVTLTVLSLAAVALLYLLHGDVVLPPRRTAISPAASWHLAALGAAFFVLSAVRLWIVRASELLSSTTGPLVGASYTDVTITLPAIRVSAVVALLAAALVLYGAARRKLVWYGALALAAHVVVAIAGRWLIPLSVQKLLVAPNELARETPYLARHIDATRRAWGLDSVETRDLSGSADLAMGDIRANAATIDNVRLWERDLLRQTFGQLQEIRTYYDFVSVNDDRYIIDGRYRQVHLAARELNTASLPTRTFINERLTFTHGMGVTMAPVNQVTAEGLPVLFIKDLPPASTISLKLTRPQIYYGQLTNSYVFVGTGQREFDYPSGEQNVYTTYAGKGGIAIGSFARRALFSWSLGSLKILLSNDLTGNARILYRRNVSERARTALPFLTFDREPYLVVTDGGQLVWMLDAYTTARGYPYASSATDGTSYMRNSVKVVVDAYDGTVDAYAALPDDPVLRTYTSIFGAIFKPLSTMPADVRRHVRYPGDLFALQTTLHATYHMTQPETFYHREDQWQIPQAVEEGRDVKPFMRHIILRLPGERDPEFIFMTPFTPQGKDNLAAWMAARMDSAHYGKLLVYRFPKQSLVYGPRQIVNRINQDTEISRQITLWDQRGSEVIRGELLVIPIEESLLYVQPLYLRAQGGSIPELKRVIVAHESRVVMGETLEQGLVALFGGGAVPPVAEPAVDSVGNVVAPAEGPAGAATALPADVAALTRRIAEHYERALSAQRAGNWAEYGREIDALGAAIRQLRSRER